MFTMAANATGKLTRASKDIPQDAAALHTAPGVLHNAVLAELIGEPDRTRPHCEGRRVSSALLSAATTQSIALYQRVMGAKFLKGTNLSTVCRGCVAR